MLLSVFRKTVWDRRKSILWWALGLAALTLLAIVSYPTVVDQQETFESMFEDMEGMAALFGLEEISQLTEPAGYMASQLYANSLLIVLLVFTISIGVGAIAGEEDRRTMDLLLAQPVPRRRVVLDAFAAMAAMTLALVGVVMIIELALNNMFDLNLGVVGYLAANIGISLLALVFGALALAIGSVTGRRGLTIGVSAALAVGLFFVYGLAPSVSFLEWTQDYSPFSWFLAVQPLRDGFAPQFGWLVLSIVVLIGIAQWGFERRDVSV